MGSHNSSLRPLGRYVEPLNGEPRTNSISRLPDNVLYIIFTVLADEEDIYDIHGYHFMMCVTPKYPSYDECLGWMRLSAVCRRWRAVLIGSATLWANVVFCLPPDIAMTALARSDTAPLFVAIPSREDNNSALMKKMAKLKGWGLSHTHRERLLKLATAHIDRMGIFYAEDMSVSDYQSIFQAGLFSSLTHLILDTIYDDSGPSPPSREDLGIIRIVAPQVRQARLSPTLPIACDNGPGLHLCLPSLRELALTTITRLPQPIRASLYPKNPNQLRWIPLLLRNTSELEVLEVELYSHVTLNWKRLFNGEPVRLPKLHTVVLTGTVHAYMDHFRDHIENGILQTLHLTLLLPPRGMSRYLGGYRKIVGDSLSSYSLDSIYITPTHSSRKTRRAKPFSCFEIFAFSGEHLLKSGHTVDGLLTGIQRDEAQLYIKLVVLMMPSTGVDIHVVAGQALQQLAPMFMDFEIKTLVIDEVPTVHWVNAMRRLMQSSFSHVTTLHCLDAPSPGDTPNVSPCTAALCSLYQPNKRKLTPVSPDPQAILPALETIVVSMNVTHVKQDMDVLLSTKDVRKWWIELVRALTCRRDAGMILRRLRIVGGWTSEKLRKRTAKMDAKMLLKVSALVDDVVDERLVNSV